MRLRQNWIQHFWLDETCGIALMMVDTAILKYLRSDNRSQQATRNTSSYVKRLLEKYYLSYDLKRHLPVKWTDAFLRDNIFDAAWASEFDKIFPYWALWCKIGVK